MDSAPDSREPSSAVELTLGKWFDETKRRNDIFLATKFGALDPEGKFGGGKQCSEPRYIKYALERSLARLRTSYIDLYYQHRIDTRVPIEVTVSSPLALACLEFKKLVDFSRI